MKTLLFCTSYFEDARSFELRYARWWSFHSGIGLQFDAAVAVDDASPFEAPWLQVSPAYVHQGQWPREPILVRFNTRYGFKTGPTATPNHVAMNGNSIGTKVVIANAVPLGMTGAANGTIPAGATPRFGYAGWWRSFLHAATFAQRNGFDRLVHIESDAAVLSNGLVRYLNSIQNGWTALWCPRFGCPESAIQVICADQFAQVFALAARPRETLYQRPAEITLPFTHVERERFAGNRYGELRTNIPRYADYAVQIPTKARLIFRR